MKTIKFKTKEENEHENKNQTEKKDKLTLKENTEKISEEKDNQNSNKKDSNKTFEKKTITEKVTIKENINNATIKQDSTGNVQKKELKANQDQKDSVPYTNAQPKTVTDPIYSDSLKTQELIHPSKLITPETISQIIVDVPVLREAVIAYTHGSDNNLIDVDVILKSQLVLFSSKIPCLFKQTAIFNTLSTEMEHRTDPLTSLTTTLPEVIINSTKIYNRFTSVVTVSLSGENLSSDPISEKSFDDSLMAIQAIFFTNAQPQQHNLMVETSNRLRALININKGTKIVLSQLKIQEIGSELSLTTLGKSIANLKIVPEGGPNLFFGAYVYTDSKTSLRLGKTFMDSRGNLLMRTGRIDKEKIGGVLLRYKTYVNTDQFTAYLLQQEYDRILNHRTNKEEYVRRLKCFVTSDAEIQLTSNDPFYDKRCFRYSFTRQDLENYLLAYVMFPSVQDYSIRLADDYLSSFNAISSSSPMDYIMKQLDTGRKDPQMIRLLVSKLRMASSASIISLILNELTVGFRVIDIQMNPSNAIDNLIIIYDFLLGIILFPRTTTFLLYRYGDVIWSILLQIWPEQASRAIASKGKYVKRINNQWKRVMIESYQLEYLLNGIYPSWFVHQFPYKPFEMLFRATRCTHYPVTLGLRQISGYPYINKNYMYNSPWPISRLNNATAVDEFSARIRVALKTAYDITYPYIKRPEQYLTRGYDIPRSKDSIYTLTLFKEILSTFSQYIATVFCQTVGPLAYRLMQTPILPGSIYDIPGYDFPDYKIAYLSIIGKSKDVDVDFRGLAPSGDTIMLSDCQFFHVAMTIEGLHVRHLDATNVNKQTIRNVVNPDPVLVKDKVEGLIAWSKGVLEIVQLAADIVKAPDGRTDIFNNVRRELKADGRSVYARDLINTIVKWSGVDFEEIGTLYSSSFGVAWLADPRINQFTIGVVDSLLDIIASHIPNTYIGETFTLIDEYSLNKIHMIYNLMFEHKVPTFKISKGLLLGHVKKTSPLYFEPATLTYYTNKYDPSSTFIYVDSHNDRYNTYQARKYVYTYKIYDRHYVAEVPSDIQTPHILEMKFPSDTRLNNEIMFILEALKLGKLYVKLTEIKFTWNVTFPQQFVQGTRFGIDQMEKIMNQDPNDGTLTSVELYDFRNSISLSLDRLTENVIVYIQPLNQLQDDVIATGLFAMGRLNEPYIKPDVFTTVKTYDETDEDALDRKTVSDVVNFSNVVPVINDKAALDHPKVEIVNSLELF